MKNIKILFFITLFGNTFYSCMPELKKDRFKKEKIKLEKIYNDDQKYRVNNYKADAGKQYSLDKQNLNLVSKILDSIGWLSKEEVGDTANTAIFLVIQHSNILSMEKYLPAMKKAVAENKANKQDLALLIDRVEMLNNRKQIYGSQLVENDGHFIIYDVIDSTRINERRKEIGLENIEDYLKRFAE